MTASLPSTRLLSRLCTPLNRDINGNPRFFLPAAVIGIEANGDTRSKVGLTKYRGKGYGPGFVIQSYNLEGDMAVIIARLRELDADHHFPESAWAEHLPSAHDFSPPHGPAHRCC